MSKKYLYILKNKLIPAYCKIGVSDNVEIRIKGLYGEWEIYKKYEIDNPQYFETRIKNRLSKLRVSGYELFNCPISYLEEITLDEINKIEDVSIPDTAKSILANINNIGKLIKEVRTSQNLTQSELAGASGVGVRFIVDLEKCKPTCEISKCLHILSMLGLNLYISNR